MDPWHFVEAKSKAHHLLCFLLHKVLKSVGQSCHKDTHEVFRGLMCRFVNTCNKTYPHSCVTDQGHKLYRFLIGMTGN